MILLLGGTSETPKIANLLAENNFKVLISNLTDSGVNWDLGSTIRARHGALDVNSMCELVTTEGITAIVDASHPYAEQLHRTAMEASVKTGRPHYRYERAGTDYQGYRVTFADNHQEAAEHAFRLGRTVLLTTGTRHLCPYVQAAERTDARLYVRVLRCQASLIACREAGVDQDEIIAANGPFTVEQNLAWIKARSIDVLVTKDSGTPGGVPQKLQAAKKAGIQVVVIKKPVIIQTTGERFDNISELVKQLIHLSSFVGQNTSIKHI